MNALLSLVIATLGTALGADELAAETCLRAKVWDGYTDGWGVRTMTSTTLAPGATRNYLVTLYRGNEYLIRTCADDAVKNVDLYLYDLNGNVVKRDETIDREPTIQYKPEQTSTFYIVVHARELAENKSEGGIAMAVTYK